MIKNTITTILSTIIGLLLGVIGISFTINSYMFDFHDKEVELQKLLNDVETKADYTGRFDDITKRVIALEEYLIDEKKIRPYYDINLIMPKSLEQKDKIVNRINSSLLSKNELVGYIMQKNDKFISDIALNNFIKRLEDEDIDALVKIFINGGLNHYMVLIKKIPNFINGKNSVLFEKAILKYGFSNNIITSDVMVPNLIETIYSNFDKFSKESLLRIRYAAEKNSSEKIINAIDKILLSKSSKHN